MQICDYCENLVESLTRGMCPKCRDECAKIRDLVLDQPNIRVFEASKRTGVSVRKILLFVQKGWFVLGEGSLEGLKE